MIYADFSLPVQKRVVGRVSTAIGTFDSTITGIVPVGFEQNHGTMVFRGWSEALVCPCYCTMSLAQAIDMYTNKITKFELHQGQLWFREIGGNW